MGEQLENLFSELQHRHALQQAGLAGMLKDKEMRGKQVMFLKQSQLVAEDHVYEPSREDDPLAKILSGKKRKRPTLLTVCDFRIERVVVRSLTNAQIIYKDPSKGKSAKEESVTIKTNSEFFRMICSALPEKELRLMAGNAIASIIEVITGQEPGEVRTANISLLHKIFYRPQHMPVVYGSKLEVHDSLFFDYVRRAFDKPEETFRARLRQIVGYGYKDKNKADEVARQIAEHQSILKESIKTKRV